MAAESSIAVSAAAGPQVSAELQRLRDGSLSLEQYLDLQVERAVSHLKGQLSSRRLELIKGVLREQISSSPALVELMKRAGVPLPDSGSNGG
jgi:hypothetical protein